MFRRQEHIDLIDLIQHNYLNEVHRNHTDFAFCCRLLNF